MKKRFCLALGMALCLAACDSKEEQAAKQEAPAAEVKAPAAEEGLSKDPNKLLEGVELTNKGLREFYMDKPADVIKEMNLILINHESPEVRAYVYGRLTGLINFGKPTNMDIFVDHLKNEKDPKALAAGLSAFAGYAKYNLAVLDLARQNLNHEDSKVRFQAALTLGKTRESDVPGIYEETLKLFSHDDPEIRSIVCSLIPSQKKDNNAEVLPVLTKILNSNDPKDLKAHGRCLESVIEMWYSWPSFKQHDENAYKETMKYFKKKPRTQDIPAWNGMGKLHWGYEDHPEWKEAAKFFKPEELVKVMTDIAIDTSASFLARTQALDVIAVHGTIKDLEKIQAKIGEKDYSVKGSLKGKIEKLQKKAAEAAEAAK